jgi:hypothetical protein
MVDDEGSTFEEILARIDPLGRKRLTVEFGRERYHVFARATDSEWWIYVAAIHRRPDAVAVGVGLVESGLALDWVVCVVASSRDSRAGRMVVVRSETGGSKRGTRNSERGTREGEANAECGTRNAERGRGRQTRNAELGMWNWELGTGNVERGMWSEECGVRSSV